MERNWSMFCAQALRGSSFGIKLFGEFLVLYLEYATPDSEPKATENLINRRVLWVQDVRLLKRTFILWSGIPLIAVRVHCTLEIIATIAVTQPFLPSPLWSIDSSYKSWWAFTFNDTANVPPLPDSERFEICTSGCGRSVRRAPTSVACQLWSVYRDGVGDAVNSKLSMSVYWIQHYFRSLRTKMTRTSSSLQQLVRARPFCN